MAEIKDKVVTVESLEALHDYDESTYLKTSKALTTLGITSTVEELNILDGVTATAVELNKLDGVTASTNEINKLTGLTATTEELNKLEGVTVTSEEINHVDGVTSNIQTQLNGKAPSSHSHSGYFSSSGGTISGETDFSGGLVRVGGVQTLFNSGTYIVLASNSLRTRIAGSAIEASQTIQVDSDVRLKENIVDVDRESCVDFINDIDIKAFNYIGNDKECIGVIAQDIENSSLAKFFIAEGEDGHLSVKVADLVFPLIATVQKLTKEVEELKARLA